MKPFDLAAAKAGKPIICRNGASAKFIAHEPDARPNQRLIVLVGDVIVTLHDTGNYYPVGTGENSFDLFLAPERKTVWVNICKSRLVDEECVGTYPNKAKADQWRLGGWTRIACVEVSYEEGEGL